MADYYVKDAVARFREIRGGMAREAGHAYSESQNIKVRDQVAKEMNKDVAARAFANVTAPRK